MRIAFNTTVENIVQDNDLRGMKQIMPLFFCLCSSLLGIAQEATSSEARIKAHEHRLQAIVESPLTGISFRSVGPTVMSGRVVDLAVNPADPTHFFVAYASGGLWETQNNGASFSPLFDDQAVMTIGAIAVNWKDSSIWIGTGEVNSSRSSYSGVGMYFSDDKGKTWKHRGLGETQHIGRVIIDPDNSQVVWVASLGKLYSDAGQEGVFKTTDGGTTWKHVLDQGVGAVDMVIHPEDNDILFASLWDRDRKAWDFQGNGPKSGIYRSTDAGESWEKISTEASGFPQGEGVGRIGLDVASTEGKTYLYAIHDNQARRAKEEKPSSAKLEKFVFQNMSKADFLALDEEKVKTFLKDNDFPEKYDIAYIKEKISKDEIIPKALYDYLADANADLFDTPVIGAEVFLFDTENETWKKTHNGYLDDVVYSYGYYFGLIKVHPNQPEKLYIAGVPLLHSNDGGATWKGINPGNVHADHHALWIDPNKDGHLINGNDGGINISYDNGAHFINCNSPAVGQFYTVQVDNAEPYQIYGGLQDNGVWRGPSNYKASQDWLQSGEYPYKMIMGGDGMQIEVDSRDNETVYTGYQFGHYYRLEKNGKQTYFHPSHELGESALRWNWQTPIHLSMHNQDILYMGSNKMHRSMNQGEHWESISPDLTVGGKEGNVPFGTITSIDESPLKFGLLYTGSDDGKVYVSPDGGNSWKDISAGLPASLWVTRVEASQHDKNRVYVTLNGYRQDHMDAYAYRSDDQGKTWKRIGTNLPAEPVNVILEDDKDSNILYVGTDHGLYISMDGGDKFSAAMNGIPHVAVHDLVIQKREEDLIVGTHGRSIYVANIAPLRAISGHENEMLVLSMDTLKGSKYWGGAGWSTWFGFYEPSLDILFSEQEQAACHYEVKSPKGTVLYIGEIKAGNGLQSVPYDLTFENWAVSHLEKERKKLDLKLPEKAKNGKRYLDAGSYQVLLQCGKKSATSALIIQ